MGLIMRTKPEGVKYMEGCPQLKGTLKKAGWLKFIKKFKGHNKEVTKTFARDFNGVEVENGDVRFSVAKTSIAIATELPKHGERWLKNKDFDEKVWRVILLNPCMDISIFRKGIPVSTLKEKWSSLVFII